MRVAESITDPERGLYRRPRIMEASPAPEEVSIAGGVRLSQVSIVAGAIAPACRSSVPARNLIGLICGLRAPPVVGLAFAPQLYR